MVREAIEQLRDHYLSEGVVSSYHQINQGLCVEFAENIESLVPGAETISNDNFVCSDDGWNGDGSDEWDETLLQEAHSLPPAPFSLEMTNKFHAYHSWIQWNGKHYDAECPEGVRNLFDLPFFKRRLETIYTEHKKTQRL